MPSLRTTLHLLRGLRQQTSSKAFSGSAYRRAEEVRIVEVGPRDGLQNEKTSISLETKIELIRRLAKTGVRNIEGGSFVSPKWVPQMANSADVLNQILGQNPPSPSPIFYNFLVPNLKGLQKLIQIKEEFYSTLSKKNRSILHDDPTIPPRSPSPSNLGSTPINPHEIPNPTHSNILREGDTNTSQSSTVSPSIEVSIFTAATESFSKANTNCTIAESLERCKPIISLAKSKDIRVRGYVSVSLGCPYEGPNIPASKVAEITALLLEMGADEISIADTTGMGTASRTRELLKALSSSGIANKDLALHFHDTFGQALVNAMVGLEHGIRTFDCSVGGLGGCPFSKGATGNVATEDLLHCFHSLGATTGVDIEEMAQIGAWISSKLGKANDSRAGKAILAKLSSD